MKGIQKKKAAPAKVKDSVPSVPVNEKKESAVKIVQKVKHSFVGKQELLAKVAHTICSQPEEHLRDIKIVQELCQDQDLEIVRLGLLTQFAIFKDIRPRSSRCLYAYESMIDSGLVIEFVLRPRRNFRQRYVLGPMTWLCASHLELNQVSKEVGRRRHFEALLLSSYKNYLDVLQSHTSSALLSATVFGCFCELLVTAPRFNFREVVADNVILGMTSDNPKVCDF
jgi:nucleolar complex protein 3